MSNDSKIEDGLFKPDRRQEPRADSRDRRMYLRPTVLLQVLGYLVAALVAAIICGVVYFLLK